MKNSSEISLARGTIQKTESLKIVEGCHKGNSFDINQRRLIMATEERRKGETKRQESGRKKQAGKQQKREKGGRKNQ